MKTPRISVLVLVYLCFHLSKVEAQWTQVNTGLTNTFVNALAVSGTNLFAGTRGGGVCLSTNSGTSWTAANTGLTNTDVRALSVSGTNLFAGTDGGVFFSTNNGTSWTAVNTGLTNTYVRSLAATSANLFVGTYGDGVFLSTNNGTSWTAVNTGLTTYYHNVFAFAASGTNLFAGTDDGVFRSTNNGTNWTAASSGLTTTQVNALAVFGTNLFGGTNGGGVFLSTNNGTSWTEVNSGLPAYRFVYALAVSSSGPGGKNLFAGTFGNGVFLSMNDGASWTEVNTGLTSIGKYVYALIVSGTNLFAGTIDGGVWRRPLSDFVTSVERLSIDLPTHFSLGQNYPNPFNPATTISFAVPSKSFVSLRVFDALGRVVSILVAEELTVGTYGRQWNAANVPSGIYFYQLQAGEFRKTKKMILVK